MEKYFLNLTYATIYKIDVLKEEEENNKKYVYFKFLDAFDYNGNIIKYISINKDIICKVSEEKDRGPFNTLEEALEYVRECEEKERNKWRTKITDVKHLLELPFQTLMMEDGGNWVDEAAIYVYKEKCKELLGIDIDVTQYSWENEDKR